MRLVYVQVHADSDSLLRAHSLGGRHSCLAARKDLSAVKRVGVGGEKKKKKQRDEIYGSWILGKKKIIC